MNPELFARLRKRYGRVGVFDEGVERRSRRVKSPFNAGEARPEIQVWGEAYVINCPFCGDTKQRLYISYCWGLQDTQKKHNYLKCFNDNSCTTVDRSDPASHWERVKKNRDSLWADIWYGQPLVTLTPAYAPDEDPEPAWPGHVMPVQRLPVGSVVSSYLIGRGLDPKWLGEHWRVSMLIESTQPDREWLEGRIIVPHYLDGKCMVWQARSAGNLPPKYFTQGRKSHHLYNEENARRFREVILVEGVFDAFKIGGQGVATFGLTCSHDQSKRLLQWPDGLIVYFDRPKKEKEAEARSRALARIAAAYHGPILDVMPPAGHDAGSLTYEENMRVIADAARQAGLGWAQWRPGVMK